jgi:hypothetical protein
MAKFRYLEKILTNKSVSTKNLRNSCVFCVAHLILLGLITQEIDIFVAVGRCEIRGFYVRLHERYIMPRDKELTDFSMGRYAFTYRVKRSKES